MILLHVSGLGPSVPEIPTSLLIAGAVIFVLLGVLVALSWSGHE